MNAAIQDSERERIRAEWLREPGFYNPWLHLGVTSITGCALIATGVLLIHGLRWFEVLFGFALLVAANAFEWRLHRDVLHKRFPPAAFLYEQHTPRHHRIFLTDEMSIRSVREFRLVLMPAYAIALAFFGLVPIMALLWLTGKHNLAAVFAVITMGYIVVYEWLHLSYHLPSDSWIGRRSLIRFLKRHHAIHHEPRLMQRWNFNVTIPLWDLVRRTYAKSREAALLAGALFLLAAPSIRADALDALLEKGPVVVVEHDAQDRFSAATGMIAVEVPLETAWAAVIDFERYAEFVPKVVASKTLKLSATERRVSWEIEVPGPNSEYRVLYHLDPAHYAIQAEQIGGDLKDSRWHFQLESAGPSRTLIHYSSSARHFSSILEALEDDQQTITVGVNVGATITLLRALKTHLEKSGAGPR